VFACHRRVERRSSEREPRDRVLWFAGDVDAANLASRERAYTLMTRNPDTSA